MKNTEKLQKSTEIGDLDPETLLITLDQISQTIEVMNKVVIRMRGYLTTHINQQDAAVSQCGRVLH